jgi:hypothetical protein
VYDRTKKLTNHFSHREVMKSMTADRFDIDNTPPPEVMANAYELAVNVLEPIRVHFGKPFSPNSWYRSEALEKQICWNSFVKWCKRKGLKHKDPLSWDDYFSRKSHPNGQAADIEIAGIDNDALYNWIKNNLEYDQLIREFAKKGDPTSGWVHVSWNGDNNRNQDFSIG